MLSLFILNFYLLLSTSYFVSRTRVLALVIRLRSPMLSRALPRSITLSHARALAPTFHVLHASLIAIGIVHSRAL
ncbi:hypothetical protein PILCRDRAFT_15648 [Piloderma croceum F 1598]|uniref:Uncharacterized protein n=1 Tax=Piloderma croceum (strain F 1598) TaxID=765440 RepID=A0A0C3EYZ5_PILCF|nr:hypothetical protein PILCRDRAFT_15648 [Piloderma croceum F 1598]